MQYYNIRCLKGIPMTYLTRSRRFLLGAGLLAVIFLVNLPQTFAAENPSRLWTVSSTEQLIKAVDELKALELAKELDVESIGLGGGTIVLEPGLYTLTAPIVFDSINLVALQGSGWNTVIKRKGDGDAIVFNKCGFATVRNMRIVGNMEAKKGSGIVLRGSSSCTIDYCRIRQFAECGVFFDGDPKSPMSSNVVTSCHFIGNRGYQIHSRSNNDFIFDSNQFGTHSVEPQVGCFLDHASAGTYSKNMHWDNVVALRLSPGSHFNRIENNRFEESRHEGIIIGDADTTEPNVYNLFTGNMLHSNSKKNKGQYSVVVAYNAFQTTFTDNQIFSWNTDQTMFKHCVVVGKGCADWIIKDNIMAHNMAKPAIVYDENAGHIVGDNLLR